MLRKDLTKPLLRLEPAFGPAFMPGNALGLQRKSARAQMVATVLAYYVGIKRSEEDSATAEYSARVFVL